LPEPASGGFFHLATMEKADTPEPAELRIQDMPLGDRPREKLSQLGPAALDTAELMALFIGSGTQGCNAIQIGRELLRRHGSLGALGGLSVAQLAKQRGLGIAKASKLAAAFELGSRVAREQIHLRKLDSPELIYEYFAPQLGHLTQEQLMVAVLDSRLRHIGTNTISLGTVNESPAHPREILRPVITRGAHAFVLVHNHPSGDPSPSRSDEQVTRRLMDAASLMQLRFVDHVIIGRPSAGKSAYFSFREAGIVH
jgi:DNA repair protein RadC